MAIIHHTPVVPDETLVDLLARRAAQTPDDIAYIFVPTGDGGDTRITYAQLDTRARRIGAYLRARQVGAAEPVLLLFHPGIDYICAFFGCQLAGAIPVPAYPPTHARQFDRLRAIIDDAATGFALTSGPELESMRAFKGRFESLPIRSWLILDEADEECLDDAAGSALDAASLAFLQYTSGSTSSPKGVMVSHGNVLANLRLTCDFMQSTSNDVTMFWLPPYHDFGLIGGILAPLFMGCMGVLMAPGSFLLSPMRWLKAISDYRATITGAPNFAYELCARVVTPEQRASIDLSSLRIAFNGAEPIRAATHARFSAAFAECGWRDDAWLAAYGLAESTLMVSGRWAHTARATAASQTFDRSSLRDNRAVPAQANDATDASNAPIELVSVGAPLPGHTLAIVDPDTRRRCEEGRVGEIWVNGPCVAQGYWRRPDDTRSQFSATMDSATSGAVDQPQVGYMRTGDLGFVHDGSLYICARHKDLIIVNGLNIYPQDVELAAFGSHPSLREDGAIAFATEADGAEQLVVVQELDFRTSADDALIGRIAAAVSDSIGMPPDVIVLVKAGKLPRTSSGKVQRRQCRQAFIEGKLPVVRQWARPSSSDTASGNRVSEKTGPTVLVSAPARSAAEITTWLREQLASRSGLSADAIDDQQNFAFYGLGSMVAVQLSGMLGTRLGRPVVPIVFWNHPTIERLASHLADEVVRTSPRAQAPVSDASATAEPIAIIGISCRFPGADGLDAFRSLLDEQHDSIRRAPEERIRAGTFTIEPGSEAVTLWGGFLDDVDRFDAQFFGIAPPEAERMDPQQRLMMEAGWQALEDAGVAPVSLAGSDTGVYVGISTHDYEKHQPSVADGLNIYSATGSATSITANRLSYLLDLRGPSLAVDTACSSSLVAVHLACQALRQRETGLALAGGVNLLLSTGTAQSFATAGMLSPEGRCKTFDADANGFVRGEGCAMIVLKRLDDALRDGDTIRAVIAGSAVMQDGRSNGLVAPNGDAQAQVVRAALQQAGITPRQLGYIEAHGTGTALGDPIELGALKAVFASEPANGHVCAVGSVKTNFGHLESAAGIAGLLKADAILLARCTRH